MTKLDKNTGKYDYIDVQVDIEKKEDFENFIDKTLEARSVVTKKSISQWYGYLYIFLRAILSIRVNSCRIFRSLWNLSLKVGITLVVTGIIGSMEPLDFW